MKDKNVPRMIAGAAIAIVTVYAASIASLSATDTNTVPAPASVSGSAGGQAENGPVTVKKPSGVELYAIHCNRCHPERYPTEFNEGEWKTIMVHMRVRANLTAADARSIMQYLREEGGN